jgi:hypothetical protein
MITTSETLGEIAPAWSKASADIGGAKKDAKNPHFKSTYTTLASVIDAAREALKANDLFVVQSPGAIVDGAIQMRTRILHKSGEWIETLCEVPLGKRDPQGVGSAQTYARRYALSAALNIPAVDDDGEAATERNAAKAQPIGAEAAIALQAEIDAVEADLAALLRYFGVDALPMLTEDQAKAARAMLAKKKAAKS